MQTKRKQVIYIINLLFLVTFSGHLWVVHIYIQMNPLLVHSIHHYIIEVQSYEIKI